MEAGNPVVQAKTAADYPVNPVTTRGQDPELYWMNKYGPGDDETRLPAERHVRERDLRQSARRH
jgi:hypothetical protein